MDLLEPWHPVTNPEAMEQQLHAELPRNHVLSKVPVAAIAQRLDQDDVLFALADGSGQVVVVHLTYSKNIDARWPGTKFYASLSSWASERMHPDHEEFIA